MNQENSPKPTQIGTKPTKTGTNSAKIMPKPAENAKIATKNTDTTPKKSEKKTFSIAELTDSDGGLTIEQMLAMVKTGAYSLLKTFRSEDLIGTRTFEFRSAARLYKNLKSMDENSTYVLGLREFEVICRLRHLRDLTKEKSIILIPVITQLEQNHIKKQIHGDTQLMKAFEEVEEKFKKYHNNPRKT